MSGQIFDQPVRPPIMDNLAASAAPTLTEGLWNIAAAPGSATDRSRAALHLLDWLGCAIAGAATPTGRMLVAGAEVVGNPFAIRGVAGATAMGGLGSLYEMDDVHRTALLHPGPAVMPAVVATMGKVPSDLLDAILCGYECMVRLGSAVGPGHYAFFHNTSTCGGIGSAAAASRMLRLSADEAVAALGHAMSTAGGFWQCRNEPSATKHVHVAEAARRGLQAAAWAKQGLRAPRRILEGPQGFFSAIARDGRPDTVLEPMPSRAIHAVSFKPWPACRHAHPAIDAALRLRPVLSGRAIKGIEVRTFPDAILFCDRPEPASEADAKFSLQHAVAVTLADGPPKLADFLPRQIGEPRFKRLRALTAVASDTRFGSVYPAHFGAEVTVRTADGSTETAVVSDAWGDSENPLSESDVLAKFRDLALHAGIARNAAEHIAEAVLSLVDARSTAALRDALDTIEIPEGR